MATLSEDLDARGLIHQMTDQALRARLDAGGLVVYAGFDPSAPSLHVGNLLQLCLLRRMQRAGHRPIALLGGVTGMIGDPGGKSDERNLLGTDQLAENVAGIRPQLEQFLDFSHAAGANQALVLDNIDWLGTLPMVDFLRDVGKHFTVNQMVAKESVKARLERPDHGISYTEFSYMLLQAYDFLRLHTDHGCTLQIGGSDQWGNITVGVDLIRRVAHAEAFGLTTPLVTKPDGTKFGKTESGTVWLDPTRTSPYRLHQFFLQVEDAVVGPYLRFFSDLSMAEISALDAATAANPSRREAQKALADVICTLVHGEKETEKAVRTSAALFGEEIASLDEATLLDVFEDAPSHVVPRDAFIGIGLVLVDTLVSGGLCASKSEARRTITGGGVYVNNLRVDAEDRMLGSSDLIHDRYVVLRRGRRDQLLVRVG